MIKKAQRTVTKAKILIEGTEGGGKTVTALKIARHIVGPDGVIVVVDTERLGPGVGKSEMFDQEFNHHVLLMEKPMKPEKFTQAIQECVDFGADAIIFDSLSDEWDGPGGHVEQKDLTGDTYGKITKPIHRDFLHAIEHCPIHLLATMKNEPRTDIQQVEGKTVITKVPDMRIGAKDIGFKFLLAITVTEGRKAKISNTKYREIPNNLEFNLDNDELEQIIAAALDTGIAPPKTKNSFQIELAKMGVRTKAQMLELREVLNLPAWSEEQHDEMIAAVKEYVTTKAS